jgi:thioredoxin 1
MKIQWTRQWYGIALIVLFISIAGCSEKESKEQTAHPYDDTANAKQEISSALTKLSGEKRVLLVFGANWCPDCRRLDASLKQPEITGYLNNTFSIVKVNIGNFDKNMDLSDHYGSPIKGGIPALVILGKDDSVERIIRGKEVAKEHKKGRKNFYKWIKTL